MRATLEPEEWPSHRRFLNRSFAGQVCPGGVTLLSGSSRVQHLSVKDLGVQSRVSITAAAVADPHLLLHLSDGRAILLSADPAEGAHLHMLAVCKAGAVFPLSCKGFVLSICKEASMA